jgi:predicted RecA/RadA family phage recombinase
VLGSIVGIAARPIASSVLGALAIAGVFDVAKVNGAIGVGVAVYWDVDGDPQGGTASTGAATTTSTDNTYLGHAVAAAGATDETVRVVLGRTP